MMYLGEDKNRWSVEVVHRDCKQHLRMSEYQVRKLDAVVFDESIAFIEIRLICPN